MMPDGQAIALYEAIAATTCQMLDAARRNDWERLRELESRCPSLIHDLGDSSGIPLTDGMRDRTIALINQALDNNRAIQGLVGHHLAQLSKLIGSVRTERKLSDTYFQSSLGRE